MLGVDKSALRCSRILLVFLLVVYNGERGVFVGEKESIRFGMIPEMPRVMCIKFYER